MKNLKTFEQYEVDKKTNTESIIKKLEDSINSEVYEKRLLNDLLMIDVVKDNVNESKDSIINLIKSGQFINDTNKFYKSFNKSDKISFLTPYKIEDLKEFNCYKLKGYNIGFAIKPDGDIILVHNNESVGGIGEILINKSVEFGGTHLDHFDGYLTGFYKKCGFKLDSNDIFNDKWAPKQWEYQSINVWDEKVSIYPTELKVTSDEIKKAEIRYESGRPDIVYRVR